MAVVLTLSPLSITPVMLWRWACLQTLFMMFWLCCSTVSHARAVDVQKGAALFRKTCIGCHAAGGNIIQPGATLFTKDLQRNGIDTEEEIYRVTYFDKGRMPGFVEKCAPRGQCTFGARLQDEEIKILAKFVKLQADQNWPNIVIADSSFRLQSSYAMFTSQK